MKGLRGDGKEGPPREMRGHTQKALGEKIVVDDENHAFIYQTLYLAFRIESKTILSAQNAVVRSGDLCLVKFTYI